MSKEKGSAVWNDAEKLSNMKLEKSPVDEATWRKVGDNRRRNLHGVRVRRRNQDTLLFRIYKGNKTKN